MFTADVVVLPAFWLGICVEMDAGIITTPPDPIYAFVPTQNYLFNESDSYLKSVRA